MLPSWPAKKSFIWGIPVVEDIREVVTLPSRPPGPLAPPAVRIAARPLTRRGERLSEAGAVGDAESGLAFLSRFRPP
jgi:hypothetical protein